MKHQRYKELYELRNNKSFYQTCIIPTVCAWKLCESPTGGGFCIFKLFFKNTDCQCALIVNYRAKL